MKVMFGRYFPKDSLVHKMDSRLKLVMILFLIVSIFFPIGFTGYLFASAAVFLLFFLSKLSWRMLLKLFIPVIFIFLIILILNLFFIKLDEKFINELNNKYQNTKYWYSNNSIAYGCINLDFIKNIKGDLNPTAIGYFIKLKFLWISEKALYNAVIMSFRIFLMITLTCILSGCTKPLEITIALEDLMWPLTLIKFPVYIISMIISISLRMIPTLIDEAGRIIKAQASRGIDIKNGKFTDKMKSLSSLIIPLLVSSFAKAEDLSFAMDARGYNPKGKRTRLIRYKFRITDFILFISFGIFSSFLIVYGLDSVNSWNMFNYLHIWHIDNLVLN